VWTDHATPWCRPCLAQAQIIQALENELWDQVVFLTVITSTKSEFQSNPTQQKDIFPKNKYRPLWMNISGPGRAGLKTVPLPTG